VDASLGLTLQPDPTRWTLGRFLEDVAQRHGPRPAFRFDGRTWTYADIDAAARRFARGLVGAGVAKGTRVGLLVANRPEWAIACFGAARVGAVVVPLSTLATPDERDYVLRHADVSLLVLQRTLKSRDFLDELQDRHPELVESAPGRILCPALPSLRRLVCIASERVPEAAESWPEIEALGDDVPDALVDALCDEVAPSDDGLLVYTSGTTAHPKGVLHRQRAAVIQSWRFAELMGLRADDRVFTAQPFFWTAGVAMSLGATLAAGGCLLLQEIFEPAPALALIEAERATVITAFPHQEKALGEHPSAGARDLSSIRLSRFSSPLAALAGITADEWGIDASYGLSETFTIAAMLPSDTPADVRRGSSGRALGGTELCIVDPESGAARATGEAGEIAVRGATLMRGYAKVDPEHVFDASGFFRTQDGGSLDADGHLHWTGRLSGLIKTGGANVSPIEIERALAAYPGIKVAAAVGVPHPTLGEIVVLCVVPAAGAAPPREAEVQAFLRERLAVYKIPRRVLLFGDEALAFTANQKVQLAPLREAAEQRLAAERAEIAGFRYGGS
jgi:acyl-CoA synthetase (AMP-forming)/AMP-acid ligase II